MEAIPAASLAELGLLRMIPRIYRGLPRVYHRDSPSRSEIHKNFTHLPSLRRRLAHRSLFCLYGAFLAEGRMEIATDGSVLAAELLNMLRFRLPRVEFYMASKQGDSVLQLKGESVGDYGSIASGCDHSLGLHFLEQGILTRKPIQASWSDVQNEQLHRWRRPENRFYLACLATPTGGFVYLQSLLKSLEHDSKDIDLCVPDLNWFVHLEGYKGVKQIEVFSSNLIQSIPMAREGKTVRLLCCGPLSQSDFRALLSLSGEWAAVRDSQTFSEALSQGKAFFYDGREPARHLIKDLAAIASNRISHPTALACIQGMSQTLLHNLPAQTGEWVDELFFQPVRERTEIACSIGLALQNPNTLSGYKQLSQILAAEFSANHFLCRLVQRALCHRQYPHIAKLEAAALAAFASGSQTFTQMIQSHRRHLQLLKD